MSSNPYVSIDRVIDTKAGQRKVVDFLHQKSFTNVVLPVQISGQLQWKKSELLEDLKEGNYYFDITYDYIGNTKLTQFSLPLVFINTDTNLTIDRNNFPTCLTKTINEGTPQEEVVIRLFAYAEPTDNVLISTILLIEVIG